MIGDTSYKLKPLGLLCGALGIDDEFDQRPLDHTAWVGWVELNGESLFQNRFDTETKSDPKKRFDNEIKSDPKIRFHTKIKS